MLGHWALGEDGLGGYPSVSGEYLYAVNLEIAVANSAVVKRGVAFSPSFNLTLAESVVLKAGAKLAATNGVVLAEAAALKYGKKFAITNGVVLANSAVVKRDVVLAQSFLNLTAGITVPRKYGVKQAVTNNLTLSNVTTTKAGAKMPAALAVSLATAFDLNVGWKPPANAGGVNINISAGIGSEYTYEGLANLEIGADFLYNQAYLQGQYLIELGFSLDADVTYRADFWSPSVVTSGSWTKLDPTSTDWSKDTAPDGAWTKDTSI